jgi:hypothetical protein
MTVGIPIAKGDSLCAANVAGGGAVYASADGYMVPACSVTGARIPGHGLPQSNIRIHAHPQTQR